MARGAVASTAAATIAVLLSAWPAVAAGETSTEPPGVVMTAVLDGSPAEQYDAADPLVLHPERELAVAVTVTNEAGTPLAVRSVELDGRVLGVTFIDYETRVDAVVPPGGSVDRTFDLDLGSLNEQAVGLLPLDLSILGADREPVATVGLTVDARGSLTSAYGLFGVLVAVATGLLLLAALVRLARGTLPANRWYRAVRFAVPGAGVGLTVAVTLSVLRVMVPDAGAAVTIVVVCGLAGLVLGFLTPKPDGGGTAAGRAAQDPRLEVPVGAGGPAGAAGAAGGVREDDGTRMGGAPENERPDEPDVAPGRHASGPAPAGTAGTDARRASAEH